MTALQETLKLKYGPGEYLTGSSLDMNLPIEIRPSLHNRFNLKARQERDAFLEMEKYAYGDAVQSCGIVGLGERILTKTYNGISLFGIALKRPGSDVHYLPRQLDYIQPVIQMIADTECAANAATRDKYCLMVLRALPLVPGIKQLSENDWHAHIPFTLETCLENDRYIALDMRPDDVRSVDDLSATMTHTDYLYSDRAGTLVQTQMESEKRTVQTRAQNYYLDRAPAHWRQAQDNELVRSNNYAFHSAATPRDNEFGHTRTFINVGYYASKALEARLRQG